MKSIKVALAVAAVSGTAFGTCSAAHAQSFSGTSADGSWSYTDSTDRFCLHAAAPGGGHEGIDARLTPVTAGRGPSYTIGLAAGGSRCVSLATAYEDSKYKLVLSGNKTSRTIYFYS